MYMEPNDPTRSGSPVPAAGSSSVLMSRNEIESLCFKASRGAGMSWGMAEEAGWAVSWLVQRGIDATPLLLAQLRGAAGKRWSDICPETAPGQWRARARQQLCPFAFGALFCDHAGLAVGPLADERLIAGPVTYPLLALPFFADAVQQIKSAMTISWHSGSVGIALDGTPGGDIDALADVTETTLTIECKVSGIAPRATPGLASVQRSVIAELDRFAMKTTVPPSERSREGAGSVLGDND